MTATALPVGAERGSAGRALPLAPVLPDARWWLENVPCRTACPVHTDAGGYVTAIAQGRFADAYRIARRPNPFPSICGRVCAAPCETKCRRGAIDAPVAIRALKRFVASRFGVEAARETGGSLWREAIGAPAPDSGKRVAIVGGGPAGLACAHDLRLAGHAVTLFESSAALGGMMVHGIPPFRLPRELIAAEIAGVTELGVEVRLRTRVGVDVRMEALVDTFDAVFVAAGTGVGRRLSVEGRDLPGVTTAVAFLAGSAGEEALVVGERVVVIGGGSVAFDAARTAARAAALTTDGARPNVAPGDVHGALQALLDVARTARAAGVREVTVVSIEGREELPAEPDEWRQAEREGVRMLHRRSVQAIVGDGRVQGVSLRPVVTVFAPDGRFAPVVDDSAPVERLDCDTVIFAVGQEADTSFLPAPLVRGSLAAVDATTLRTSNPKVWAGGDIAFGPRFLINAIADGRRAAAGISAFLASGAGAASGDGAALGDAWGEAATLRLATPWHRHWSDYDAAPRAALPVIAASDRTMGREVEGVLDEGAAVREAQRCLRCHANVTLRAERCILCGLCADVCPERCIALRAGDAGTVVLSLDEARCIRCGLCVERCPPQALTMVELVPMGTRELAHA